MFRTETTSARAWQEAGWTLKPHNFPASVLIVEPPSPRKGFEDWERFVNELVLVTGVRELREAPSWPEALEEFSEDASDIREAQRALDDPHNQIRIPWAQVKADLNLSG